jgi:predicted HicB family RNase H-like nuclease
MYDFSYSKATMPQIESLMEHKGYYGSMNRGGDDEFFFGRLEFIEDDISYHGKDMKALRKAFERGVDQYNDYKISEEAILDKAKEEGIEQGIEKGEKKKALEVARKLIGSFTAEEIAQTTGLTLEEIKRLTSEKK